MKSNQTKTMAATFRLTAVRFALVGIAALCIAGCGKDAPPGRGESSAQWRCHDGAKV